MAKKWEPSTALKIFMSGTLVAAVIALLGAFLLNPKRCPEGVSEQEVIASGCTVGTNIGLWLVLGVALLVWLASIVIAMVAGLAQRAARPEDE